MSYVESDAKGETNQEHPIPSQGIGCFRERLKTAMTSHSLRGFSKLCGLSEATLRSYLSGATYPTLDRLMLISEASKVDPQWLAFGTEVDIPTEVKGMDDYAFVPLYDAQCSAGDGAWNEGCRVLTHISFTRYSLRKQGLTPDHLSAIRIDGDSMEPDLHSGDTVLIDHTRIAIEGEGIYILRLDGHLYAKRLQRNFDGVSIISSNKEYREVVVPRDRLAELEIVGRAVWSAGWL
ncbi:S24 family peptidase [Vreelandella titanicae]|uniref:HTH-type transcriptional regulator n=1 Tax=Vreelandella titanicae TaxID=664683 RepID=A0AAP9NQ07_9GAMM|nr:S24 family peptidase [Halomonas titanicae]QKS24757.1 putative HTH-type transcriptional regulator [Halomonas titanicae]SDJ23235.1 Phage repressor protein C, contains Cro/C1-type HTH and peptisase s24 domains [Halomonas titanicae]